MTAELVAVGQQAAEALMLDRGRAERPTGRAYDPAQQADVDTFEPLFTSRCKVQARGTLSGSTQEEAGGRTATTVRIEVHLPVDTAPLTVGDVWEVTSVAPGSTAVVGRRYRVTAPQEKSFLTARRYDVEVVVS